MRNAASGSMQHRSSSGTLATSYLGVCVFEREPIFAGVFKAQPKERPVGPVSFLRGGMEPWWLVGWLVGWLAGWLVGWWVGWWVGGLVSW